MLNLFLKFGQNETRKYMFVYRDNIQTCEHKKEVIFLHKVHRVYTHMFGRLYLFTVNAEINQTTFLKNFLF